MVFLQYDIYVQTIIRTMYDKITKSTPQKRCLRDQITGKLRYPYFQMRPHSSDSILFFISFCMRGLNLEITITTKRVKISAKLGNRICLTFQSILRYDSHHWTSQASYRSVKAGGEFKLPGYWLRNFTKICVTMYFEANSSTNYTSILLNYPAQSLHSALHEGIKILPVELPKMTIPFGIDSGCLVKGLNMHGPASWPIKSRVGVRSKESPPCSMPYLVRGIGIGSQQVPEMSCGEIIISNSTKLSPKYLLQSFPALCRIYIQ